MSFYTSFHCCVMRSLVIKHIPDLKSCSLKFWVTKKIIHFVLYFSWWSIHCTPSSAKNIVILLVHCKHVKLKPAIPALFPSLKSTSVSLYNFLEQQFWHGASRATSTCSLEGRYVWTMLSDTQWNSWGVLCRAKGRDPWSWWVPSSSVYSIILWFYDSVILWFYDSIQKLSPSLESALY